jgi:P2 family phage major capsid protein
MQNNKYHLYLNEFLKTFNPEFSKERSSYSMTASDCVALENTIKNQSSLLSRVNIKATVTKSGQADFFDLSNPITRKTDTRHYQREAQRCFNPSTYTCQYTDHDVALPYATVDAWTDASKSQEDFNRQAKTSIERRIALDRIMVGFNGTSSAVHSDLSANSRLQDVNKGWLQIIREQAPVQVLTGLQYGSGQAQQSLGRLLRHAINTALPAALRDDPLLVAIIGADLLPDPLAQAGVDDGRLPDLVFHQQRQGGMRAASAAFFPGDSVLITRLDNLSLYFNANSHRLHYEDQSNQNQIALYQQTAEAFVIENLSACLLLDNVSEALQGNAG